MLMIRWSVADEDDVERDHRVAASRSSRNRAGCAGKSSPRRAPIAVRNIRPLACSSSVAATSTLKRWTLPSSGDRERDHLEPGFGMTRRLRAPRCAGRLRLRRTGRPARRASAGNARCFITCRSSSAEAAHSSAASTLAASTNSRALSRACPARSIAASCFSRCGRSGGSAAERTEPALARHRKRRRARLPSPRRASRADVLGDPRRSQRLVDPARAVAAPQQPPERARA